MDEIKKLSSRTMEEAQFAKTLVIMNHKGGCAKSSLADALSHRLASLGRNVLVIDNDSQCNLSQRFGLLDDDTYEANRMDVFYSNMAKRTFTEKQANMPIAMTSKYLEKVAGSISLIPGHPEAEIEAQSARSKLGLVESRRAFREHVRFFSNYYDDIVIDTPPATFDSASNEFSACVADEVIVPFDGSEAVIGISRFFEWLIKNADDNTPNGLFVMTKYQCDTKDVLRKFLEALSIVSSRTKGEYCCGTYRIMKNVFGNFVCDHAIPERRVYKNHTYDGLRKYPDHRKMYDELCEEIISKVYTEERPNLFKIFKNENLGAELRTLMIPLEHGRHDSEDHEFYHTILEDISKVKSRLNMK
jgi:cellulose biosynthesis protein BcsQ